MNAVSWEILITLYDEEIESEILLKWLIDEA